jgi:tRNA-dihydrouridine synthase
MVLGNGDVTNIFTYNELLNTTSVDGVMIARAAIRNPWIFKYLNDSARTLESIDNSISKIDKQQVFDAIAWPSVKEVEDAQRDYLQWVKENNTKPKYAKFHELNFQRLKHVSQSRQFGVKVVNPKTIHL